VLLLLPRDRHLVRFWKHAATSTPRSAPYTHGRNAPSQAGDEVVGGWSREQLETMDSRFAHAVERAIRRGKEHTSKGRDMKARHL
jgi:hypothetical protein